MPLRPFSLKPAEVHFPAPLAAWLILALWLIPGLIGHDPWKDDDAITIGVAFALQQGSSLTDLTLAGTPFPGAPLFYLIAQAPIRILSGWLPLHDAVRLTSGLFTLITLLATAACGRQLFGRAATHASPLFLAGSLGLLLRGHEAQPAVAVLAAAALLLWGMALLVQGRSGRAAPPALIGSALLPLAGGLPALLAALTVLAGATWLAPRRKRGRLLLPLACAAIASSLLVWLLAHSSLGLPTFGAEAYLKRLLTIAASLPWYAWPSLPVALWALWSCRRQAPRPEHRLLLVATTASFLAGGLSPHGDETAALIILLPLSLLAADGVGRLRRGAANALDWFASLTGTLALALAWLGGIAIAFGIPAKVAANFSRQTPGFIADPSPLVLLLCAVITLGWLVLLLRTPRSPFRNLIRWSGGVAACWAVFMLLWGPSIDYAKSYRPVANSLKARLTKAPGCILGRDLSDAQRASLDYFSGIRTVLSGSGCQWLISRLPLSEDDIAAGPWSVDSSHRRPGNRHEQFTLWRRQ